MTIATIDSAEFRRVLGHYPTGVAAVTAVGDGAQPLAMVIGSFTSVSLAPPLVGFLPAKTSRTWPRIANGGGFAVNVLSADQEAACRQLAGGGADAERFSGLAWRTSTRGLPLLDGVVATIECSLHSVTDAGDHLFVLGLVEALEVCGTGNPLIFHRGRYGGFAEAL